VETTEHSQRSEQPAGTPDASEPVILAFCCHYCAYAAADLAGSLRLKYPANVRLLRVPCTGKVEINHILRAFEWGVDGVIVAGCLEGGCHFLEGNLRARKRVERTQRMLEEIGIEPERLEMFNLSSAEGPRFAEIVGEMTARLRQLGPSPLRQEGVSE
jgi:coenzyme F420-reducing hydrogenase delta subunit